MIAKKPVRSRVRMTLERLADGGWRALSGLTLAGMLEGAGLALMEEKAPGWGLSAVGKLELRALERLEVAPWR